MLIGSCSTAEAWALELKPSYYRQAVKNVTAAANGVRFDGDTEDLFAASSMD